MLFRTNRHSMTGESGELVSLIDIKYRESDGVYIGTFLVLKNDKTFTMPSSSKDRLKNGIAFSGVKRLDPL